MLSKTIHGAHTDDDSKAGFGGGIEMADTWSLPLRSPCPSIRPFFQKVLIEHLLGVRHVCSCAQEGQGVFPPVLTVNWETACDKA